TSVLHWRRFSRRCVGKVKLRSPKHQRTNAMSDNDIFFVPDDEEGTHYELLPAGFYEAEIVDAEAPPKTGDGRMLTLDWQIGEGPYTGRHLRQWLCYRHSNSQTETFARQKLKDVCEAVDVHEPLSQHNLDILKYKPARLVVGILSDKEGV